MADAMEVIVAGSAGIVHGMVLNFGFHLWTETFQCRQHRIATNLDDSGDRVDARSSIYSFTNADDNPARSPASLHYPAYNDDPNP